jgi:DNA polymerase, archaea type
VARKGDTPEYVLRMQQDLFDVLTKARSLDELRKIEPVAKEVRERYMSKLEDVDVMDLAIHRRVRRMNYSRRCSEASAVQTYQKRGLTLAPGM